MDTTPYLIEAKYQSMHRVERKIADYVLENPECVIKSSIHDLAHELNIAQSSIVRFCKGLGCSGYKDFKLWLAAQQSHGDAPSTILEELSDQDSMQTIAEKVFQNNMQTLQYALQSIDNEKLEIAVETLALARKIYIFGLGASASIADDFYIRLMRIGMEASAVTDAHLCQIASGLIMETDAVVAISHTGKTADMVRALSIAREAGAKTISITGYLHTPIASVSDICLEIYSPKRLFLSPRVVQVSLIDSLYVGIAIQKKHQVMNCVTRMEEVLNPLRIKNT